MIVVQVRPGLFRLSSNGCELPVEAASNEALLVLIGEFQKEIHRLPEVRAERANSMASARAEALADKVEQPPKPVVKRPKRPRKRYQPRRAPRPKVEGQLWARAHTSVDPKQQNPLVTAAVHKLTAAEWVKENWKEIVYPKRGGSGFLFSYNLDERMDIARHYINKEVA